MLITRISQKADKIKTNQKQKQDQNLMIELVNPEANKGSERCTTP